MQKLRWPWNFSSIYSSFLVSSCTAIVRAWSIEGAAIWQPFSESQKALVVVT
jgi:hypothetical protein